MPHSLLVIALLVGYLAAPSVSAAGELRGRRGALVGTLTATALTGPSGVTTGMHLGRQSSIIMTGLMMRALGIDPIVTCGTGAMTCDLLDLR